MTLRPIKYRAWDLVTGTMRHVSVIEFDAAGEVCNVALPGPALNTKNGEYARFEERENGDDLILLEFTGLHDKNGKEIYSDDYLGDWCVFWGNGKYILQNISTGDIIDCTQTTTYDKEVTGNRYETPREHTAMASDL